MEDKSNPSAETQSDSDLSGLLAQEDQPADLLAAPSDFAIVRGDHNDFAFRLERRRGQEFE